MASSIVPFFIIFLSISRDLGGPGGNRTRENQTLPSRNCPVVHDPLKIAKRTPLSPAYGDFFALLVKLPPPHPLYSLRSRKQLCLACRLAFVISFIAPPLISHHLSHTITHRTRLISHQTHIKLKNRKLHI